jgi:muramidase (phage lysozyme)
MDQKAYQSQLKDGAFTPVRRAKFDKQRDAINARQERGEQNYLRQLEANSRQEVQNAGMMAKDVEALSAFSKTLTESLVERQKEKNNEEMERGMMLAYTDGVTTQQEEEFNQEEADLEATAEGTKKLAQKVESRTGNVFVGEQIRGLSGWAAYGYAKGKAQQGGMDYTMFFTQAAETVSVNINGKDVTLDNAATPAEYSAVQSEIRRQFLSQYSGMNPALLNKYMFPTMREFETKKMMTWSQERSDQIKADRETALQDDLYTTFGAGQGGQAIYTFVNQYMAETGATPKEARQTARNIILAGIRDGKIDPKNLDGIDTFTFTDRNGKEVRLIEYWGRDFGDLKELVNSEIINDMTREENLKKAEALDYANNVQKEVLANEAQGIYLTEGQKKALEQESLNTFGYVDPKIKNLRTKQDRDDETIETLLRQKLATGQPITFADLRDASDEVFQQYSSRAVADPAAISLSSTQQAEAKGEIESLVSKARSEQDGLKDKSPMWKRQNRRAQAYFQAEYAKAVAISKDSNQAYDIAMGKTTQKLKEDQNIWTEDYSAEADQEYGKKITNGINTLSEWSKTPGTTFGQLVTSRVIPGTEDEIEQLKLYAQGKAAIPSIYSQMAAGQRGMNGYDLARAQYKAATGKDLVPPPAEEAVSTLDPKFQRLLKYRPTSARTRQVMVGSGDRTFLDLVASKESAAYGEYDAYNLGGSDFGRTAYGSGNSAVDGKFGVPISQLSVGEILKLHADGNLHAAGRYQFIGDTFREVVGQMGLPKDTIFTPEIQDRMAIHRARWRVNNYGMSSLNQEWVGLQKVPQAQIDAAYKSIDPFNAPDVLTPGVRKLAYVTGNIGPTSTGEHLDVKDESGQRFHYRALDKYVEIDDPEFGTISLGDLREKTGFVGDSWDQHKARNSHGIDYGAASGSEVFVKNGAQVVSSVKTEHGDKVTIQIPTGKRFTFLHGKGSKQ